MHAAKLPSFLLQAAEIVKTQQHRMPTDTTLPVGSFLPWKGLQKVGGKGYLKRWNERWGSRKGDKLVEKGEEMKGDVNEVDPTGLR